MLRGFVCTLIVSICASTALVAQVEKGDVELAFSGSLGWTRSSSSVSTDSDSWGVRGFVDAGYFVSRRVDVGGQFGAGYSDFDDGHRHDFSLGPALNYHFRPATDIVPFVGLGGGYIRTDLKRSEGAITVTTSGWYAEVHGGADFFINRFVAIKLRVRYNRTKGDSESNNSSQTISGKTDSVDTIVGLAFFFE